MSNTRKFIPLQSAIAAWVAGRGGGLVCSGQSDMTHSSVPFPIYRGLTR